VGQRARIVVRIGRDLGEGHVPRRLDEGAELTVGDRRLVDPESVDFDEMRRRLFRVVPVRSHAERAARDPSHARAIGLILSA
jgi:hypothetical protein